MELTDPLPNGLSKRKGIFSHAAGSKVLDYTATILCQYADQLFPILELTIGANTLRPRKAQESGPPRLRIKKK